MKLQIQNLSYAYKSVGTKSSDVLKQINLNIEAGEFVALVGPSGAGKTTLIRHLNGLLKPDTGSVLVDGENIHRDKKKLNDIRKKVGLVFQFPEAQLFGNTVFEDVAFGPQNLGKTGGELRGAVRTAMQQVGLDSRSFGHRSPFQLSFGEKRKVALAGILAMQPDLLALDEPTAGLDYSGLQAVSVVLKKYHSQKKSILLVTHNLDLAAQLADRMVVLNKGKICFDGQKNTLFENEALLQRAGLALPRIRHVVNYLHRRGFVSSTDLNSLADISRELRKYFEGQ